MTTQPPSALAPTPRETPAGCDACMHGIDGVGEPCSKCAAPSSAEGAPTREPWPYQTVCRACGLSHPAAPCPMAPAASVGATPRTEPLSVRSCGDGIAYPGLEGVMPTAAEDEEIDKAMRAPAGGSDAGGEGA